MVVVIFGDDTEQILRDLPKPARDEVGDLVKALRGCPAEWPARDGMECAWSFGRRSWVLYVVHANIIEVLDIGWTG
ncbi:hypothetical protein ACI2LO_33195 [Streptomyces sp. NPDC033754]|uniref:hypothetical protein n=1 Tax=unclassified Streptomyces TaxID=2593676 RepID=UPI0033EE3F1E